MDAGEVRKLADSTMQARKFIHDANNALFVAKGFAEEIGFVVKDGEYKKADFDAAGFANMVDRIAASIDKVSLNIKGLGQYVREDVFSALGVENPDKK